MKFTIIIPVYNSSLTIEEVLVSVKNQTYKDFEICIINDGSTDDSLMIIERFIKSNKDVKIKLISTHNGGVSKARNLGIKYATGEYIALLDSDDLWHIQKLELMLPLLDDKYSFFGHAATLDSLSEKYLVVSNKNLKEFGFKDFLLRNRFVTPSVIFKNNKNFLFDETMRYAEDHDLWLRLSYERRGLYLNLPLVKLNRPVLSKGGASSARWKMRKGEIKMYYKTGKYSILCWILFPILVIFSLLKHVKGLIR